MQSYEEVGVHAEVLVFDRPSYAKLLDPLFHHLAKVCEGKRFFGSDNRFDNDATAGEISSETLKLG